ATGAMIVYWKANDGRHAEANEQNLRAAKVMQGAAEAYHGTAKQLVDEIKKLRQANDELKILCGVKESELNAEIKKWQKEASEMKGVAEKAYLEQEKAFQEAKRLQAEVQLLNDVLAKREKAIIDLQVDIKKYVNEAQVQREYARSAI